MSGIPEEETEEAGGSPAPPSPDLLKKKMDFLTGARRQLSTDELSSPIVSRFLIEEIERLDNETQELRSYRDEYHRVDKELSVLREQQKHIQTMNLRDAGVLAVGSAGLGAAPSYIETSSYGWVFFVLSAVLVIISFRRGERR